MDKERRTQVFHLIAMFGLAVAQPLYSVLVKEDTFFLGYQLTFGDTILVAALYTFVLPFLVVVPLLVLSRIKPEACKAYYDSAMLLLATMFFLPFLKVINWPAPLNTITIFLQLLLGLELGLLLVLVIKRSARVREFLAFLCIATLIFPVNFVLSYPSFNFVKSGTQISSNTPVILIVFDEMPTMSLMDARQQVDAVRYPNFAAFGKDSTFYRYASTVHSQTFGAVPAILDGKMPKAKDGKCVNPLPTIKNFQNTLFTELSPSYKLHAFESYLHLCPSNMCMRGLEDKPAAIKPLKKLKDVSRNFISHILFRQEYFNPLFVALKGGAQQLQIQAKGPQFEMYEPHITQDFLEVLEQATEDQSFYFFHPLLPHAPFEWSPEGKQYFRDTALERRLIRYCEESKGPFCNYPGVERMLQKRHLLQVVYTDKLLGEVMARLKKKGMYDKALIIVTADHGISFTVGEQNRKLVTPKNFAELMAVPVFVKMPFQKQGRVSDEPVETIDIYPTIFETLGAKTPPGANGKSLTQTGTRNPVRSICAPEEVQRYDLATFQDGLSRMLARQVKIFGTGSLDKVYLPVGLQTLAGKNVSAFPNNASDNITVKLDADFKKAFASVNTKDSILPAMVAGEVVGAPAEPAIVLVAVNGRIEAAVLTIEDHKQKMFMAPVPEDSLKDGKNELGFILMTGDAKHRKFARLKLKE